MGFDSRSREEWIALGKRRIRNILRSQTVAALRTLEQKISDAGPRNQRVDPHHLTTARGELVRQRVVASQEFDGNTLWFYLATTPADQVEARLAELLPIHRAISSRDFTIRLGQTLEIAIYRALLLGSPLPFLGGFRDLDAHGDDKRYSRDEPPSIISGNQIPDNKRFDFVVFHPTAGPAGIEAKNVREWLYIDRREIRDLLWKAVYADCVPVLIARRIHYSTFSVLRHCGLIVHQTYNQLYPTVDAALAAQVANKNLLGYHDVRVGNQPDDRLRRFLLEQLPALLPSARSAFKGYKDLVSAYVLENMPRPEFIARVKRRSRGEPEDLRPFEEEEEEFLF